MNARNLSDLGRMTEDEARSYLERIRWPNGPVCPHCKGTNACKLEGESTRPGVYKCRAKGCRKPFTVTVGSIFEKSHIPLRTWVMAFHLMCASKKGVSALQLQRTLGLGSYKSAWHMAHRIRHAMAQDPLLTMLSGTVEADETYIGGKPRFRHPSNAGRYRDHKAAVFALVQRDGHARAMVLKRITEKNVRAAIYKNVDMRSRLMTDEAWHFLKIGREFEGGHETTNHSRGEYLRGNGVHSNTAESFFSLAKRMVMGAYHQVSKAHLPKYLDELTFRWNGRFSTDQERTENAIKAAAGKRLTFSEIRPPQDFSPD